MRAFIRASSHPSRVPYRPRTNILQNIPSRSFAFFFIDPKGRRIDMKRIAPLLRRPHSEVVFNFMFDFIHRAASIESSGVAASLDELILDRARASRLSRPT